ncbi:MAG TPA: C40 family peptidase [Allocoleopsis sp.]
MSFIPNYQTEYRCLTNLNLYNSPQCNSLATQAFTGRHLQILPSNEDINKVLKIRLCEDNYIAWLSANDYDKIKTTEEKYQPVTFNYEQIQSKIPEIINFTLTAMNTPNYYLWGGTVAPNYDCSGLMQAAFYSQGIWIPRDSFQQQEFTQPISFEELQIGDLIFFAKVEKITHVALYLGHSNYIHSSGKQFGRNGIGIDSINPHTKEPVSQAYLKQLKCAGRVIYNYNSLI